MRRLVTHYFLPAVGTCALLFGCPFRRMTGIPCPLCGMTRAVLCLLRGDVSGAFHCHPLFFLLPVLGVVLLLHANGTFHRIPVWIPRLFYILCGILFAAVWVCRLWTGTLI